MRPVIHTTTRVQAGGKVEFTSPELKEGETVEVTIKLPERLPGATRYAPGSPVTTGNILEFLASLPPSRRTPEEWEEFEREFQRERDSWDR